MFKNFAFLCVLIFTKLGALDGVSAKVRKS